MTNRLARALVLPGVVASMLLICGGVAGAADASVSPTSAAVGSQVQISGGCGPAQPGDTVLVLFHQGSTFGAIADEALADNGQFSFAVTIPQTVDQIPVNPGAATLEIVCDVEPSPAPVLLAFTVLAGLGEQPPAPPTDPPASTGTAPEAVTTDPRFTG